MTTDPSHGSIPRITVPVRLRLAREHAGLDQTALANAIGSSRRTISAAENGERMPRKTVVMAWSLATGVPLEWIEHGKTPPPEGDGVSRLPHLDSNQEPLGYPGVQVTALSRARVSRGAA